MKIVQGLDTWYPDVCGPLVVVTNYCKYMNIQNQCKLVVPSFGKKTDEKYEGDFGFEIDKLISLPVAGYRNALTAMDKQAQTLYTEDIDLLHAHSPFEIGKLFLKIGMKRHIPTILTFHTLFKDEFYRILKFEGMVSFVMDYIMRNINKFDYVFTVSNGAAKALKEYGYKGKVTVIRNGTDMVMPNNPNELIEKVNDNYSLTDCENVFLFVGRIVETKNISLVLNALSIAKAKGLDFKFVVVGDGPALPTVKKQVTKLGLSERVIFTGMITDRNYLQGFYLRSDLFLFPSSFDTASLVPIEAATFALPTLLIKDSPTSEIIIDSQNGYTEPDNAEAWAERLCKIVSDKADLARVSENCKNQVYRHWSSVVEEVLEQYKIILGK